MVNDELVRMRKEEVNILTFSWRNCEKSADMVDDLRVKVRNSYLQNKKKMERVLNEPTISVCIIAFFVLVYLNFLSPAFIVCTTRFNTFCLHSAFICLERILVLTRLLL